MYRPTGVHIDDPKGMFILRWYKEVDLHGNALSGHQNKDCVAYKLTLDNDGEPFRWTSNVQLISKVYLKKLTDQPRTYTLNKKDTKMVRDAAAPATAPATNKRRTSVSSDDASSDGDSLTDDDVPLGNRH